MVLFLQKQRIDSSLFSSLNALTIGRDTQAGTLMNILRANFKMFQTVQILSLCPVDLLLFSSDFNVVPNHSNLKVSANGDRSPDINLLEICFPSLKHITIFWGRKNVKIKIPDTVQSLYIINETDIKSLVFSKTSHLKRLKIRGWNSFPNISNIINLCINLKLIHLHLNDLNEFEKWETELKQSNTNKNGNKNQNLKLKIWIGYNKFSYGGSEWIREQFDVCNENIKFVKITDGNMNWIYQTVEYDENEFKICDSLHNREWVDFFDF